MVNGKTTAPVLLTCLVLCCFMAAANPMWAGAASAEQENWQKEFDDVCSKTQDAMIFSQQELKSLVDRCDALEPQIAKLDETRKKVYLKRLQQCRGLYSYVLESKKQEGKK